MLVLPTPTDLRAPTNASVRLDVGAVDRTQPAPTPADSASMKDTSLRMFAGETPREPTAAPRSRGLGLVPSTTDAPTVRAQRVVIEPVTEPPSDLVRHASVSPIVARSTDTLVLEAEIITTLDRPAEPGQPAADAFRCKEHALGQLFGALSIADARALHRRLTNPVDDDPIATRFARLVIERQDRLIAFLSDARRRAAIASARSR